MTSYVSITYSLSLGKISEERGRTRVLFIDQLVYEMEVALERKLLPSCLRCNYVVLRLRILFLAL